VDLVGIMGCTDKGHGPRGKKIEKRIGGSKQREEAGGNFDCPPLGEVTGKSRCGSEAGAAKNRCSGEGWQGREEVFERKGGQEEERVTFLG